MRRLTLITLLLTACGPAQTSGLNTTPGCPATWADAQRLCNAPDCAGNTTCVYPHMGDQLGPNRSDWADAVLGCFDPATPDGGSGVWRCAQ